VTASHPIDTQIRYILTQNGSKLKAESYTQDNFIALLSELAAATWKAQDREPVSVDAEAAVASTSLGARATAFLQLCVNCGFLVRGDVGTLQFRDSWLHGYLAACGLVHLLEGEYSDRGLTRDNAAIALAKIGSPAIPVLIAALADPDDAVGLGASFVLRQMGPTAVPALIEAISFGNRRVRRWVTSALSSKENANAALPVLLRVLEDDDQPLVVGGAIVALQESKNPEAEPALIAALRHSHPIVQTLSKQALNEFDSPRARRALDDLARPAPGSGSHASPSRESRPTDEDERGAHVSISNSPRIFISYAKEDVRLADELRRLLKLADFDPWMDSAGLLAGDAWEARLAEVIRTSDFVVALLSEHSAGGYQGTELLVAVKNAPSGRNADVPFVLPCAIGDLLSGDTEEAIPNFLDKSRLIRIWNFNANWRQVHESLYMSARSAGLSAPMLLRSKPRTDFDEAAATQMIVEKNFFDSSRNKDGRPAAATLNTLLNGVLVEDRATGRIWTRNCGAALPYIGQTHAHMVAWKANADRLGGADDWRLPTLEEAMSLMTREKSAKGVFISHHFSDDGYVLTCDTHVGFAGESMVWVACYALGDCQEIPTDAPVPVRLVRTDWEYLQ
jgi:TIR domain-containing protein/HEAT repeat protein/uncharacterized protein DUF1566